MRFRPVAAAFLFLGIGGCLHGPSARGGNQIETVEDASRREVTAFLQTDANTLDELWSDEFIVTNPLSQVATKRQVLEMVRSGFLTFRSYDRRSEYTRHYGDLAIIVGSEDVEWSGRMPLAGKPVRLRFTAIWRDVGGRWMEVARHANVVPPTDEPAAPGLSAR